MKRPCASCGIILQTHEKVVMEVTGIYREVPSIVVFAIRQDTLQYVDGTLRHAKCPLEGA